MLFASSTHERESYCLLLYTAAAMERMQLLFELLRFALKLVNALFEREQVVSGWVVHAFQRFREPRNLSP